jgi:sigma-B regulation protein RsbU (phosphoserine phosphatase)
MDSERHRRGLTALLSGSPAGLTVVAAAVVKLLVVLAGPRSSGGLVGVIDTLTSVVLAVGGAYFVFRGLSVLRRRLLWRVRRKLIISYLFVGLIPALLIIGFFLLGGYLLFVNVSSYMLQTHLRDLGERVRSAAQVTALEVQGSPENQWNAVLARRRSLLTNDSAAVSIALVPVTTPCGQPGLRSEQTAQSLAAVPHSAGPWPHLDPPVMLPAWIGCEGHSGLFVAGAPAAAGAPEPIELFVRAVALPPRLPGQAVVVDVPIDASAKARLRADTSLILNRTEVSGDDPRIQLGRASPPDADPPVDAAPGSGAVPSGFQQAAVSFLEYRDWSTGQTGTVQASMTVSIAQIYARLTVGRDSASGLSLSQAFVFVLIAVGVLFLFIQVLAIAMGLALAKSITGSVHELFTGTVKVQQGDFTHRIAVRAPDQLGALAESFNSMTASIEGLLLEAAEKKRLEEELRIAHEIQMSLLPQAPASIPGLSIAALCVPAREVGGDYYDFLPLQGDRLGLLIADVAGKGTSAALYMAELKGLMLSLSRTYGSPRELLIMANHLIAEHLDARSFITMTYAIIDLRARTMTYARAGHTPLLYLPGGADGVQHRVQLLAPDGLVLGLKIDDGALFDRLLVEQTLPLRSGDVYVLFTDGISEAMNAQDDCYGEHRLSQVIEAHAGLSCDAIRDRLVADVLAFAGDTPQHDDMTMILLKVGDLPTLAVPAAAVHDEAGAPVEVARR